MERSNENHLRWQFGKSAHKRYAPNITLLALDAPCGVELLPGESAIARVERHSNAAPIVVTDARVLCGCETLLRYADVRYCDWIDTDIVMAGKLKPTHFDQLIIEQNDGTQIVIDRLGQAVFPLLNFFWRKLGKPERKRRRAAVG